MVRPEDDRELWRVWIDRATHELGLSPDDVPVDDLLRLTAVVAHGVDRPMAPISAFLVGLAMGRGTDRDEALEKLTGLAQGFTS